MLETARLERFDALFVHVPTTVTSGGTLADATVRAWMRDAIVAFAKLASPRPLSMQHGEGPG
jgi:hypothetical protein